MSEVDLSSIEKQPEYDNDDYVEQQENEYEQPENYKEINQIDDELDQEDNDPQIGINHRRKVLTIQFYLNEFPDKLKQYGKMDLDNLSGDQLDELRKEMDFVISTRSNVNMGVGAFVQGINTLEHICVNHTPLKVKGLSQICNDKELIDDVKSLILSNMTLSHIEPEYRIGYKIITSMLYLHNINGEMEKKQAEKLGQIPDEKENISLKKQVKLENINQKFEGL